MEKIAAFAGTNPANYDNYLGPFLFEPFALDLVSRLQDKKYNDILEIACGTGRVTKHLASSAKYDTFTATDLSADMITVAKEKVVDKEVKWMEADAMELPFEENSFDLAVIQFGVMFFPDKLKGLSEVHRVLRSGGTLIFNTWDRTENVPAIYEGRKVIESYFEGDPPTFYSIPFSMHDEKELYDLAISAGFRNVKVELVKKAGYSPSSADLATGIVEGNPIYLAIVEKDPSLVNKIREHVERVLFEKFGKSVSVPLQAWLVQGTK
jgi:ubiquinone/menaquinone biosynthesis C-methylase UbiE